MYAMTASTGRSLRIAKLYIYWIIFSNRVNTLNKGLSEYLKSTYFTPDFVIKTIKKISQTERLWLQSAESAEGLRISR